LPAALSTYGLLPAAAHYGLKTRHLLEANLTAIQVVKLTDDMVGQTDARMAEYQTTPLQTFSLSLISNFIFNHYF
jgi:hypothetical protein